MSYLNTRPLAYGLRFPPIDQEIELIEDNPASLADLLASGAIDVGLIPVASIPGLPEHYIVGDYCIGTETEVASVCLFSEVPLEQIDTVLLDYQSRSSVALLKWLMKESWGIHPRLVETTDDSYRKQITGRTAGLVIGDRAFEQRKISTFIFDLASEWKSITGLPFVFAAWVSTRPLAGDFVTRFNHANALGLEHLDEIVAAEDFKLFDLRKYYTIHLSYLLDERKRKGMDLFLRYIS